MSITRHDKPLTDWTFEALAREWDAGTCLATQISLSLEQEAYLLAVERELFSRPEAAPGKVERESAEKADIGSGGRQRERD